MEQIEKIKELLDSKDPVNCKIGLEILSRIPLGEQKDLSPSWLNACSTIFMMTPILIRESETEFREMVLGINPIELWKKDCKK
jgi:hypothetical protein